jgi:selenide,water dikinase
LDPRDLVQVLSTLPTGNHADLLVGAGSLDDAAVMRWPVASAQNASEGSGLHLVQTLDFITPVVDDARTYGQISAANALSDIYAMGGKPRLALNVVAFPSDDVPLSVLGEILLGGQEKVAESGAILAGGHSIKDAEPKYGLVVTGEVSPENLVTNQGARPGDVLVLSKPLGTGLAVSALRKDALQADEEKAAIASMVALNKGAAEAMLAVGVHAATDITGFGLLGHAMHIALGSQVSIRFSADAWPLLPGTLERAEAAGLKGAAKRNRDYVGDRLVEEGHPAHLRIATDPQTSGGLLMAVAEEKADALLEALKANGTPAAAVVGQCEAGPAGQISISEKIS